MSNYKYLYYNDKKILFIHIPRTAGTSIYKSFKLNRIEKHSTINYLQHRHGVNIDDYWIIGSVRNPWKRLFSLYNYTKLCKFHTLNWKRWLFYSSNITSLSHNQGSFPICKTVGFYRDVLNKNSLKQVNYFLDKEGNVAVDEIIQLENIENDVIKSKSLGNEIGVALATHYAGPGVGESHSWRFEKDWRNIYDSEDIEYVREISEWEINKFNYTFEEI